MYNQPATAIDVLTTIPRFGRSSNFADIWGTQDEKREYILGLVFWGILLFSLCFLWSISIIIWKCLGRQKVGFLSGAPFIRPQAALSIRRDRSFWYRLVFLNAALLFIVCGILFVTQGITNLRTTLNTFIYSTEKVQYVMIQVNDIIYNVRQNAYSIHEIRDKYAQQLEYLTNQTCWQRIDQSNASELIRLSVDVHDSLLSFNDSLPLELGQLQNSTRIIRDITQTLSQDAAQSRIDVWKFLLVIIMFIATPSIMIAGVCVAWFGVDCSILRRFLSWIVLPIFVIQVIFAYTVSSGLIIVASANADFCAGGSSSHSPDSTVEQILLKLGYREGEFIIQLVSSYFQQCSLIHDPLDFLRTFHGKVEILQVIMEDWNHTLKKGEDLEFGDLCEQQMLRAFSITHILQGRVNELLNNVRSILYDLRCEQIAHLYESCVYVGLCDVSITGLIWAFTCLSSMSVTGLIVLTFRSCWQLNEPTNLDADVMRSSSDNQLDGYLHDGDDEFGGYTGYDENNDSLKDFLVSLETEETENNERSGDIFLDENSSSK